LSHSGSSSWLDLALYEARVLVMARVQAEAEEMGADAVVSTYVKEATHGRGSLVI
jgi:uncharacterized protein YbjQ (UPF0145 family)